MTVSPSARDPEFYLSHSGYVRALARHVVFDAHLADEVEQQTWLAALEQGTVGAHSPRAWLKTLVRNFARKAWRAEAHRSAREELVSRTRPPVATPDEIVEHESARKRVVDALLALEEPYRSTLALRFFEELTPTEIARRLDLPVETVRTHIKRGLERMRVRLRRDASSSWGVMLVCGLKLEPLSYRAAVTAAAKAFFQGVLIVSVAKKLSVAGALIALLVAALLWWPQRDVAEPVSVEASLSTPPMLEVVHTDDQVARDAPALDRAEVPSAPEAIHSEKAIDAPASGSLFVRVTWGEDGSPASDVGVRLLDAGMEDWLHNSIGAHTRADGTFELEHLPPGRITLSGDRGGSAVTEVVAGQRAQAALVIPRGFNVDGLVADEVDRPVAGAEIFLHPPETGAAGFVVAHSDERGKFAIRSLEVRSFWSLSARKSHRAPTKQSIAVSSVGATLRVKLVFEGAGIPVAGRVIDEQGDAVAHAQVLIGDDRPAVKLLKLPDGSDGTSPLAQLARADDAGLFHFEGVALGTSIVQARAKGFAPWKGEIDTVHAGSIEIRLARGATLQGVVRDEHGAPLERVYVELQGGDDFGGQVETTARDGTYLIRDVPLGSIDVVAGGDERGKAKTTLTSVSGAQLRWDAVLVGSLALTGHIVAPGRELAGWVVNAQTMSDSGEQYFNYAETDAHGHFAFKGIPDTLYRVMVSAPGGAIIPAAVVTNVRPGDGELTIEPDPALEPSVRIVGRVLDPEGRPIGGAQVLLQNPAMFFGPRLATDANTGRFDTGLYPPGEWTIETRAPGLASYHSGAHKLARGETWDLGDVQLVAGGTLVATLRREGAIDADVAWIKLVRDGGSEIEWLPVDGAESRSGPIAPGKYAIKLVATGKLAPVDQQVEIRAGVESRVEIFVRAP